MYDILNCDNNLIIQLENYNTPPVIANFVDTVLIQFWLHFVAVLSIYTAVKAFRFRVLRSNKVG